MQVFPKLKVVYMHVFAWGHDFDKSTVVHMTVVQLTRRFAVKKRGYDSLEPIKNTSIQRAFA